MLFSKPEQSFRRSAKSEQSQLPLLEFHIEPLEDRTLLAVSILAAGATGEETIALQVDGTTVRTWTNVGGDYDAGVYETLTYDVDNISPNQLRIVFLNDGISSAGEDRNVRIDHVNVDGVIIETESSEVFSSGSWDTVNGCAPGFKQSELLHCENAYFDFSNVSVDGSSVIIRAAGNTGEETMELQIDGQTVATWDNVGGDYENESYLTFTYQSNEVINANQVRVAFVNDVVDANGDRNLRVDNVEIDGVVFESEAPNVFSVGSWRASDGCDPGFKESEQLNCNGYFQFAQATGSLIEIAAAGSSGTERIELVIDGVVVAGWNNVGGDYDSRIFQTLTYQAGATVTADQIRVAFVNDGVDGNGVDKNVRIDGMSINGQFFESEANTVFSTGTWRASDGCDPGFKASEELHCGGYLQFAETPANPGIIALETSVYSVGEDGGSVDVVILRTGGSDGLATVDYRTVEGSANENADYTPVSGRVIFQDGETSKSVTINILQDALSESDELFSFTIDNVGGTATLLVPRTANITIQDDESDPGLGGFEFDVASFDGSLFLDVNGVAAIQNGQLQLTQTDGQEVGSAFYAQPLEFDADTSFRTSFQFEMTGGQGAGGADGFTFVLHNTISGSALLGTAGGALGYIGTSARSIAIEFDTYKNDTNDIDANHISLLQDGLAPVVATVTSPVDLNSGAPHYVWIEYDGQTNQLDVYLSATAAQPGSATLSQSIDLAAVLGSQAYFGFTAATGGLTNQHTINSWAIESSTELVSFTSLFVGEEIITNLNQPTAIEWSPDGRNMYIAEKSGIVRVVRDGVLLDNSTIDISQHVNGIRDRGLLDIAVHPDFANTPYLYLLYTYDPPEVNSFTGLAGPDGIGNRAGRLTRVTLDAATSYTTVIGSEVILLGTNSTWDNFNGFVNSTNDFNEPPAGILPDGSNLRDFLAADSESHTVGSVEFGLDGALYVSNGDGASYNQVDPRAVRVQDIDNLSGKILRIDPITGAGLSGNPFFEPGDAGSNRSKVYQYGLRNPFRISVAPDGQVFVGDVGWFTWEEINAGQPGDNFGWPYYEGGTGGVSLQQPGYSSLPEAQAFYASGQSVAAPFLALSHSVDGINAIVLGDVYTGTVYSSEYQGDVFFNDLGQGIVRNVSFDTSGNVTNVSTFATGAQVVVQMKNGPDGHMYYVDLDDGLVGRWILDASNQSINQSNQANGGSGSEDSRRAVQLAGVNQTRRSIKITPEANGSVIVNLADRTISTEDGYIEISDEVRRIVASGNRAADNAIYVVATSGDDDVTIKPNLLKLNSDSMRLTARNYELVHVHGHDGIDSVRISGSRGDDRFEAGPNNATMVGAGFAFALFEFDSIEAVAGRGGHDEAVLNDSRGDDLLIATDKSLELSGAEYRNIAIGFSQTVANSTTGDDVAIWYDDFRGSQYMAGDLYAALIGNRLAHELNGWSRLYVESNGVDMPV